MSAKEWIRETSHAQLAEKEAVPGHEAKNVAAAGDDGMLELAMTKEDVVDISTGSQKDRAEDLLTEGHMAPESEAARDGSIPGSAHLEAAELEEMAVPGDKDDKPGARGVKPQRASEACEPQHGKAAADDSRVAADAAVQANSSGEARGEASPHLEVGVQGLSKNQLKKKRKREQFEERKIARRLKEKEKRRMDVERRRAEREAMLASLSPEEQQQFLEKRKQLMNEKRDALVRQDKDIRTKMLTSKCAVCIDLEWFPELTEREQNSLMKQLNFAYSSVKKAVGLGRDGLRLSFSGVDSALREILSKKNTGYDAWPVVWSNKTLMETFDKGTLVYLTHESPHVLHEMDPYKVYIVGGIVDRNRIKGGTAQKAKELGISTARLDLDPKKMRFMTGTTVLTVNHVVELLLEAANGMGWQEAVRKVLPSRKGLVDASQTNTGSHRPGKPASQTTDSGAEDAEQPCADAADETSAPHTGEKDSQPASDHVAEGTSSRPSLPDT